MKAIISNGNYTASVQLPVERRQLAGALAYLGAYHASANDIKYNEESDKALSFTLDCRGVVENAIAKAIPTGFRFHTFNDTIALMHNLPYLNRREFENTVKVEGLASYEQLNRMLTEAYPQSVTTKYYCPLTIQVHSRDSYGDIDEDGYEEDAEFAARHEDDIRQALMEYNASDECNMAEYFHGNNGVSEKLRSADWDPVSGITTLIIIAAVMACTLGGVTLLAYVYNLNHIKSKTVGDGQHGTARWATKPEIRKTYAHVPYTPSKWRAQAKEGKAPTMSVMKKGNLFKKQKPQLTEEPLPQGIVVGCQGSNKNTVAMVDTGDVHALMIGAAGVGKTAFWLYPCIEYACASGMSFLSTDTKGDVMRNYGTIAKEYGYKVSVIDLRNPTRSNGNNLLHLVNKYMDLHKEFPEELAFKAKAEKYAKIISKTIILSGMDAASFGQNAYFYDAAEGILTATILLVAEFCEPDTRHIVSVFKIIQELLAPTKQKGKNQFHLLMEKLPNDHKAKWFAGSALNTGEQSMASVMSTALSRLNAFLDSELEQLLCFDTEIDAEVFCSEKSAVFIIMPEENPNTFFMISLILQQMYREILAVADENGGKLKNRCVFFCDEYGTLPKIQDAEMMFSASRSRRLQIVPIIQSFSQLDKNYGKEGAEIIVDNTQLTIFGGFAPNSTSAEVLSKALGSRTVLSGSVSRGKNDPSQSLQMIERPLMTPDELKSMPKGQFVVMKTGAHPMKVRLKLFFNWGITFDEKNPYTVKENANRRVKYASRQELEDAVIAMYPPAPTSIPSNGTSGNPLGGMEQTESQSNEPQTKKKKATDKRTGNTAVSDESPSAKKRKAHARNEAEQNESPCKTIPYRAFCQPWHGGGLGNS